jgi:hypothetical protein
MSDLERILDSGSLEDIDKVLSQIEAGATEEAALAAFESGETVAETPPADPPPSQTMPVVSQPDEPPVILAKDGKNQIPYSVLEDERRQATALKQQLDELSRRNALLEQQLTEADIQPKDIPENIRFTPEQIEDFESYGEIGQAVAVLAQQNAALMDRLASAQAAPQAAPAPSENPLSLNPDTLRWAGNDSHWGMVENVNGLLDSDPVWSGKSLQERIPEIVRRTKAALGEPLGADVEAQAAAAIAAAQRVVPNSLTDVGGEVPGSTKSIAEQLAEGSTLDVEAYLAKQTAAGKSMDDVLASLLL